jgi:hypothetical protein
VNGTRFSVLCVNKHFPNSPEITQKSPKTHTFHRTFTDQLPADKREEQEYQKPRMSIGTCLIHMRPQYRVSWGVQRK